jgi:hypothetical protein
VDFSTAAVMVVGHIAATRVILPLNPLGFPALALGIIKGHPKIVVSHEPAMVIYEGLLGLFILVGYGAGNLH